MDYATFEASNKCISGGGDEGQKAMTKAKHGDALQMCFHFHRRNCIGKHLTSQHLAHYVKQFVKAYSSDPGVSPPPPHVAFLSFVDAQEDTLTII